MKIAIWHNLPSGGGKRALYDQVRGLKDRGHHVEAWCPATAHQNFLPLNSVIDEHIIPLDGSSRPPRGRIAYRKHQAGETEREMKAMEKHCQRCAEEISTKSFDVLLVHPCLSFRVSPMAKYSQLPNILYLAEPFRQLYEGWPHLPWIAPRREYRPFSPRYWNELVWELIELHNKRVQVREEKDWAQHYDQILVNSLFSRESVMRAYNLDSRVCYLGVDMENFSSTGGAKEKFVIGLGNIAFNKRPLLAVQAVGAMPPRNRPKLVWVGNFAESSCLDEVLCEAEKLNVTFVPKILIPDSELRILLCRAAVMIFTAHLEPFGYAPLEANACGTGVVAVAEGGVRETIVNSVNGILALSSDPEELANALMKFTDDLDFSAEFGRSAQAHVRQHWSHEKAIDRLEAELNRALELFGNKK